MNSGVEKKIDGLSDGYELVDPSGIEPTTQLHHSTLGALAVDIAIGTSSLAELKEIYKLDDTQFIAISRSDIFKSLITEARTRIKNMGDDGGLTVRIESTVTDLLPHIHGMAKDPLTDDKIKADVFKSLMGHLMTKEKNRIAASGGANNNQAVQVNLNIGTDLRGFNQ